MELTLFQKLDGPLTKRISLAKDGTIDSDGSACVMASGTAERLKFADAVEFAGVIAEMRSDQAIALGALRPDLPAKVQVVTKQKINGATKPGVIARTGDYIDYQKGRPAYGLLDYDTKGMPPQLTAEVERREGFWKALVSVLPALSNVARVSRPSTSAGLYREDTDESVPGSDGRHIYLLVDDGADVERFLKALHERCWLAGFGWMIVGAAGQLLERSIIDRMVGAPERLVFEGAPVLSPPLRQKRRPPIDIDGGALDTERACPPLSTVEKAKLEELKAKWAHQLAPDSAKVRAAFIDREAKRLAERIGVSEQAAAHTIARQCKGMLLSELVLPFDDRELANRTVGDVLNDPYRFEGATLADPLEGVAYGVCIAKIMLREDGTPWIHSFAHGRTIYELKFDLRAVRTKLEQAPDDAVLALFIELTVKADISDEEIEELRDYVNERTGVGKRKIDGRLRAAREQQRERRTEQERIRRRANRRDPRPQLIVPLTDAPWLPEMQNLNEVLSSSSKPTPPTRNMVGMSAQMRRRRVPGLHAFTPQTSNREDDNEPPTTA
jgi:hypothetical protein